MIMCSVGCSVSRQSWSPDKKYPPEKLRRDFTIFRSVLEESHPSLYWFTPKDSMDYYFDYGYSRITDSMTENQFKYLLSYITNKIRCGHTTVKNSSRYRKYIDTSDNIKVFPLNFRVYPDHLVLTSNLHRRDSILRRGTVVTRIDGLPVRQVSDTLLNFLSWDGNSVNGKYQVLSNRGTFGNLYQNIFGPKDSIRVNYIGMDGLERETVVPLYIPKPDSTGKIPVPTRTQDRDQPKEQVLNRARNIQIDTTLSSAYMTLNTFSRGNRLRPFFRKAFRVLDKHHIRHLVIDVRSNGGGDAGLSTLLTRYIADKKFKLADSLYTNNRRSKYSKYIKWQPLYWTMMQAVTKKKKDGRYHFTYFEDHYFYPRKKHHFKGDVYIITGGNSFSATTLFAKALQGQKNVTIVGEETGGGAYGNSAWMIPDVILPNTKIRFRLPRFRLVMDKDLVKEGRGLIPDIEVMPTPETIRMGIDPKVETVRQLIIRRNGLAQQ